MTEDQGPHVFINGNYHLRDELVEMDDAINNGNLLDIVV